VAIIENEEIREKWEREKERERERLRDYEHILQYENISKYVIFCVFFFISSSLLLLSVYLGLKRKIFWRERGKNAEIK
jgi:hypothetical protein